MVTRCCCPPDNSAGRCPPRSCKPTDFSASSARFRDSLGDMPAINNGNSTFSTAVKTGRRLNDWKIKPNWEPRRAVRSKSDNCDNGLPWISTSPAEISSKPDRQFSRVVFPQPDGPKSTKNSLSWMVRLKSSTPTKFPQRLVKFFN